MIDSRTLFFFLGLLAVVIIWPTQAKCINAVKTRHQQCLERGYPVACRASAAPLPDNHNECTVLLCGVRATFDGQYVVTIVYEEPLERTECGDNKICLNKQCVPVPSTEMPKPVGSTALHHCWSRCDFNMIFGSNRHYYH